MLLYQVWHLASGNAVAEFEDEASADDFIARQARPEQWIAIPDDPEEDDEEEEESAEEEEDVTD